MVYSRLFSLQWNTRSARCELWQYGAGDIWFILFTEAVLTTVVRRYIYTYTTAIEPLVKGKRPQIPRCLYRKNSRIAVTDLLHFRNFSVCFTVFTEYIDFTRNYSNFTVIFRLPIFIFVSVSVSPFIFSTYIRVLIYDSFSMMYFKYVSRYVSSWIYIHIFWVYISVCMYSIYVSIRLCTISQFSGP